MTSLHNHEEDQVGFDQDELDAARILIRDHENLVLKVLLSQRQLPTQMLKQECLLNGERLHDVMARHRRLGSEDDTASQSSRPRAPSDNSHSQPLSLLSTNLSSFGGDDDILWIMASAGSKPVSADVARHPFSEYLIRANVVRDRLRMPFTTDAKRVQCNSGPLRSVGFISLDWASTCNELTSRKGRRNTFYVVEELPDSEVFLVETEMQESPASPNGNPRFFGNERPQSRNSSFSNIPRPSNPYKFDRLNSHGKVLQQLPVTKPILDRSTVTDGTERPYYNRPSLGLGHRRESTTSDDPRFPGRKASKSSTGSTSQDHSYAIDGQPPKGTTPLPPDHKPTPKLHVIISCRDSELPIKLDLDAPGEQVYEALKQRIKKKIGQELDRDSDEVRFTTNRDDLKTPSCCLSLEEGQVAKDWESAVLWLKKSQKSGPRQIYALIAPDDD